MKRMMLATAIAALALTVAAAQSAPAGEPSYVGRIELGVSIAGLSALAETGDEAALAALSDRAILLLGTLSAPSVAVDEPFEAVVEFMQGEWRDPSTLLLHRVFIVFRGEAFRSYLQGSAGKRAVVVARKPTLGPSPHGGYAVYLEVVSARTAS
ncbi:MAG TPA: hypothetical protein PLI66_04310 [Spirochaetales bacterium]|nr:hypothetical protein [Spirochaetales bacterium]HQO65934.1 hypothetical protein [Spirochaetales bacterium]